MQGLKLENVTISLAGQTLVQLDCAIAPGEVLTVMGPSGSGKSTLLAYIAGFLDPAFAASGAVRCGGADITLLRPEQRHAGILFQDPLLFPHMSVAGNLIFALPQSVRGSARKAAVTDALADVDMAGFGEADPATLSGGQKARIALARVLLSEPRMLLLDEPFSRLDAELRGRIRELVFSRAKARELPMLLVTHDSADAEAAGGPVIRIGQ